MSETLTTEQVEEILASFKHKLEEAAFYDDDSVRISVEQISIVSSLATELLALRKRVALLEPAVIAAQSALAEYIVPDSGISEHDCVNNLLGILDDQDFVRQMRALPTPKEPS